jgi:uncharacterized GH25 family protein
MKKIVFALVAFVLFSSHIMYLKLDSYFLKPDTPATIQLFNGTFDKSENVIDRDRMLDASLLGNGQRIKVDDSQWTEKDSITLLNFTTGAAGTWVAGISTAPRSIEMDAEAFNTYLEHEGILDMLDSRRENDELDGPAVEKYSKHVKAIFQVGDKRSNDWEKTLGYPIEFVPLENPYDLNTGDSIRVKLLFKGKPLANQLVYADFETPADAHKHEDTEAEHSHSHDQEVEHTHEPKSEDDHSHEGDTANTEHEHSHADETNHGHADTIKEHNHASNAEHGHSHDNKSESTHSHDDTSEKEHSHDSGQAEPHQHTSGQKLRSDAEGIVTAKLTADGIWYLQTIHLVNTEEEGFTHESNWTTLTFEVVHAHGADTHTHEHEEEGGIPSYVYWIGSILLVALLFFWFNKKK